MTIAPTPTQPQRDPKPQRDLAGLFEPRGIAVVGASEHMSRFGGRVLRHLVDFGYQGAIYPVNPKYDEVLGLRSYATLADVPDPVDLVVICIPAPHVAAVIEEAGVRGLRAAVVHSDGFVDDPAMFDELRAVWKKSGLRVVGPNTNGVRVASTGMFADASSGLATAGFESGPIGVITQSGGLGAYFGSTYLRQRGVGSKYLIDTGNEMDVNTADCLEWMADDPEVTAIGLLLESARDGRRLVAAIRRAIDQGKTVVLLKLATNTLSLQAAASHSGAIAGRFDVFSQILAESGAKMCTSPRSFADALMLCAKGKAPAGPGIGVVTPSGGFGVLAGDLAGAVGLHFPQPAVAAPQELRDALPLATFANPLDVSGQHRKSENLLGQGVRYLAGQPGISSIVVWQPHTLLNAQREPGIVAGLTDAARAIDTPVYLCGSIPEASRKRLWDEGGILCFDSPDDIIGAVGLLVGEPGTDAVVASPTEPAADASDSHESGTREVVVGQDASGVLAGASVELVRTETVADAAAATRFAAEIGRPIMLKVQSAAHAHKTEAGLVVGPVTGDDIAPLFEQLARRRDAVGGGTVTAESFEVGVEVAIGILQDLSFGAIVMVGAGGKLVELLEDVSFAPAPVDAGTARAMIERLALSRLLHGFRGSEPSDVDALVDSIVAISRLAADPEFPYDEADVNPIMVRVKGQGAVIVDALFVRTS